jgi:seryl-tRNA synthetase
MKETEQLKNLMESITINESDYDEELSSVMRSINLLIHKEIRRSPGEDQAKIRKEIADDIMALINPTRTRY